MKKYIIILAFLTSCTTSADECQTVTAEYVQFISYQDVKAHRFHGENIYFWYESFDGEIGKKYRICVNGNDIIAFLN